MNPVIFLFLRRMRAPLIVLIGAYAISILGMVLVPGLDNNGDGIADHLSFYYAFYVVSYTATTIGFGELPYEFSPAQRLWAMVVIYLSVVAWLYAIGKILALIQEPAFRQAVIENAFERGVRLMREPFYILCGCGDTGTLLLRAMSQRGMRAVVIDRNPDRLNSLDLEDLGMSIPSLAADASVAQVLIMAGLRHRHCIGVVAITDDDSANLKVAITAKLLHPGIRVICRAETADVDANMRSFGTDWVINPYENFADRLAMAIHSPGSYLLYQWLTGVPDEPLPSPLYPPHGMWVICGYGRFGKAVFKRLRGEGIKMRVIEADPSGTDASDFCIVGRGTEAATLEQAHIKDAVGIVAGTDNDANNLSIVMTAADLNPDLFMVARQNRSDMAPVFAAATLDLVMQRSEIMAHDIFSILTTPLLKRFLDLIPTQDNEWANQLVSRITAVVGEVVPQVWSITINQEQAPAVSDWLHHGRVVLLDQLLRDSRDWQRHLPVLTLLHLRRNGKEIIVPEEVTIELEVGDRLLFCAPVGVRERMHWTLQNLNALRYAQSGQERADSYLGRKLQAWQHRHHRPRTHG
jgi:voltage-gated potassium channel